MNGTDSKFEQEESIVEKVLSFLSATLECNIPFDGRKSNGQVLDKVAVVMN